MLESRLLLTPTVAPFQDHIWATSSGLHETDETFSLGMEDFNGDGKQDMYAVKKSSTGTGMTEFVVYSGADEFDATKAGGAVPFIHAGPTALPEITDPHFQFRVTKWDGTVPDLIAIDRSGPTGFVNVYIMRGEDDFMTATLYTTIMPGEGLSWDIDLADYNNDGFKDLIGVKRNGLTSTEIHIASGAVQNGSRFQSYLLQTTTALHPTNADFSFQAEDMNGDNNIDIVVIRGANTGSGKTEVHVLNGAGTPYSTFSSHIATGLHATGDSFEFAIADMAANYAIGGGLAADGVKDLIAFSKSNTGSNTTEVHAFSGVAVALKNGAGVPIPAGATIPEVVSSEDVAITTSPGAAASVGTIQGTNVTISGTGVLETGNISAQQVAIQAEMKLRADATMNAPGGVLVSQAGTVNILGGIGATTPVTVLGETSGTGVVNASLNIGTSTYQAGQVGLFLPGNSPGQLTVGDLTMNAGSELHVEIQGASAGTQYDQIRILRTATFNSPRLVLLDTFAPAAGTEFVIVKNDGSTAIAGSFLDPNGNALAEGAVVDSNIGGSGRTARISYRGGDGNDVVVVVDGPFTMASPVNGTADNLTLRNNSGNIEFLVNGVVRRTRLAAGLTTLTMTGEAGKVDALLVDLTNGNPIPSGGLTINFGTDATDTLAVAGGTVNSVLHNVSNSGLNSVEIVNAGVTSVINYNKASVVTDQLTAAARTMSYSTQASNVTVANPGTAGVTRFTAFSRNINVNNPTASLSVLSGAAADNVTISGFGSGFNGSLAVNTGAGTDTVTVSTALTLPSVSLTSAAIRLNGSSVTTTGSQAYSGAVQLGANATFAASTLHVNGTMNGAFTTTLNVAGTSTFSGAIGGTTTIGNATGPALTINSTGPTEFQSTVSTRAAIVQSATAGIVTFRDNVMITAAATNSQFNGSVVLDGLTFKTPRSVVFGDAATDQVTLSSSTVTFDVTAGRATFVAAIDGSQGLTKLGAGELMLNTPATYAGPTQLLAGTLLRSGANRLPDTTVLTIGTGLTFSLQNLAETIKALSGDGNVLLGNAPLTLNGGDGSHSFSGVISGTGSVSKLGGGEQTLAGMNTYTGTTLVSAGTLNVTGKIGTTTPAGLVTVGAGATLNASSVINARLSGAATSNINTSNAAVLGRADNSLGFATLGNLTVNGGTLQLLDSNNVTLGSTTTINDATLSVARSIEFTSGQTLTGSGTIAIGLGNLSFTGATLAPTGILATPAIVLDAASTMRLNVGASRLNVTGTVTLNNPALVLNPGSGYVHTPGQHTMLIDNDGTDPIVGGFADREQGSSFNFGPERFSRVYYRSNVPERANDFTAGAIQYVATPSTTVFNYQLYYTPDIDSATDSNGNTIVVSSQISDQNSGPGFKILDPYGNPIGGVHPLNIENSRTVTVTAIPGGGFALVGQASFEFSPGSHSWGTFVLRVDTAGNPVGALQTIPVSPGTTGNGSYRSGIIFGDDGRYTVAWRETQDSSPYHYRIVARRFDPQGIALDAAPVVITPFVDQSIQELRLIGDRNGNALVMWTRYIGNGQLDVVGRRFNADGTLPDANSITLVASYQPAFSSAPAGDMFGDGSFAVAFRADHEHVIVRRFNASTQLISERSIDAYNLQDVNLSGNASGQYAVSWYHATTTGGSAKTMSVQIVSGDDQVIFKTSETIPATAGWFDHVGSLSDDGRLVIETAETPGGGFVSPGGRMRSRSYGEPVDAIAQSMTTNMTTALNLTYDLRFGGTSPLPVRFFKSADAVLDASDQVLTTLSLSDTADLTAGRHTKSFTLGSAAGQIPIPGAGLPTTDIDYHILAFLDPDDLLFELDTESPSRDNVANYFVHFNFAPVISDVPATVGYVENAVATVIAPTALVTDPNSSQTGFTDFAGGSLTLTLTANGTADDRLEFPNQGTAAGQIGKTGTTVKFGGVAFGTFAGGSGITPLVVTLNSNATPAAVQALLRIITFRTLGENPSTAARTLSIALNDGDGATGSTTTTINVTSVNDGPVLSGISGTVSYSRNTTAGTVLASSANVMDADHSVWTGGQLRVRVSTGANASNRIVVGTGFSVDASSVVFSGTVPIGSLNTSGGTGTTDFIVSFNSSATTTLVRNLIRSIRFKTVDGAVGNRRVHFQLTDPAGGLSSELSVLVNVF